MSVDGESILNLNVGLMGHVDSGKTSLARVLSTECSTAALDKHPQSMERGITLDLGFSAITVDEVPAHLLSESFSLLQLTLVDCPGHASLMKTILLGAQIVDVILLVVDVAKGVQTQTAECLVLADIIAPNLVVALNKIDLIQHEQREKSLLKMTKKLGLTLRQTRFGSASIIPVSTKEPQQGIEELKTALLSALKPPNRDPSAPLLMAVDHCFTIKGQGTIVTGTVLKGGVCIGESVEVSSEPNAVFKIRSMQKFKRPVKKAVQGDRVALCLTGLDSNKLERGLVFSPGYLRKGVAIIINLITIPYFMKASRDGVESKSKFHVTIGHETCLAQITLFKRIRSDSCSNDEIGDLSKGLFEDTFEYVGCLDKDVENESNNNKESTDNESQENGILALLHFDRPVLIVPQSKILGSKLDGGLDPNACRLAFHGNVLHSFSDAEHMKSDLVKMKVFKTKSKEGVVDRVVNEHELICRSMFKKDADISVFSNLKVQLSTGEKGILQGSFGQSGKFKIRMSDQLKEETIEKLKKKEGGGKREPVVVKLDFKRHVYSNNISQ